MLCNETVKSEKRTSIITQPDGGARRPAQQVRGLAARWGFAVCCQDGQTSCLRTDLRRGGSIALCGLQSIAGCSF